jgi:hypothetical protein
MNTFKKASWYLQLMKMCNTICLFLVIDFDVKLPRAIISVPGSIYLIMIRLTDKREQPRTRI